MASSKNEFDLTEINFKVPNDCGFHTPQDVRLFIAYCALLNLLFVVIPEPVQEVTCYIIMFGLGLAYFVIIKSSHQTSWANWGCKWWSRKSALLHGLVDGPQTFLIHFDASQSTVQPILRLKANSNKAILVSRATCWDFLICQDHSNQI